jgi:hypothetical protein
VFDRDITTFVREADGRYRRQDEYHRTILIDTSTVPGLLRHHGLQVRVGTTFDDPEHPMPRGLRTVVGHRA